MTPPHERKTIKAVERSFEILDALRRSGGSTISELSKHIDLSPGAIHTHLTTLKIRGYVIQEGNTYRAGPSCLLLGAHVRNNSKLFRAGKGQADEIALETGEVAHLLIEHDGRLLVLHERFGEDAVGRSFHQERREHAQGYLHCTAGGKAILANLPQERFDSVLSAGDLTSHTANTITDPATLSGEITDIRENGYALEDEEHLKGIRGVGAPIMKPNGDIAGSIAVSGPTSRIKGEYFRDQLPELVTRAANLSEVNLQTGDPQL